MRKEEKEVLKKKSWLMKTLWKICRSRHRPMKLHRCRFEDNVEAAEFNARWLKHYRWDLSEAIEKQKGTMLEPGSEFRKWETVKSLWERHTNCDKLREILMNGLTYPLEKLSEEQRKDDLEHMVVRGNHKSAQFPKINAETLRKNYEDEIKWGWILPIPKRILRKLKGA